MENATRNSDINVNARLKCVDWFSPENFYYYLPVAISHLLNEYNERVCIWWKQLEANNRQHLWIWHHIRIFAFSTMKMCGLPFFVEFFSFAQFSRIWCSNFTFNFAFHFAIRQKLMKCADFSSTGRECPQQTLSEWSDLLKSCVRISSVAWASRNANEQKPDTILPSGGQES